MYFMKESNDVIISYKGNGWGVWTQDLHIIIYRQMMFKISRNIFQLNCSFDN